MKKAPVTLIVKMLPLLKPIAGLLLKGEKRERFLEFSFVLKLGTRKKQSPRYVGFGFEYAKRRLLRRLYPEIAWSFFPMGQPGTFYEKLLIKIRPDQFWVWSYRDQDNGLDLALPENCPITRVEDGFIRSFGLGVGGALPSSLCLDKSGLHFDSRTSNDLETILNNFDEFRTDKLMARADRARKEFIASGFTKYIFTQRQASSVRPVKGEVERVLVLGQVEEDQSIQLNPCSISNNRDLLARALKENPRAEVIYRAHPDVVQGLRKRGSDVSSLSGKYRLSDPHEPISELLNHVDTVYTISSLAGFEALIRDVKVKTFGCPFYAGWGVTEDDVPIPRRNAKRSINELMAAAYLIYPLYFDPETGTWEVFEDTIERFKSIMQGAK